MPLFRPTGFSRNIKVSPFDCWQFWVTLIFDATHIVPHNLRPCASATSSWMVRKLRKSPLSAELAGSESLQKLFVDLRGQIGSRARRFVIRNRPAYAFVYRGCDK